MSSNVVPLRKPTALLQLRIELDSVRPRVWRVIQVPESIPMERLHRVIQIAMGWQETHLHEFIIGKLRYGTPDPEFDAPGSVISEKGVALAKALGSGRRFRYTYDFGDDWGHTLTVEERGAGSEIPPQARCLAGENACPPEDVGGPPGYAHFLEAIADPSHEAHRDMLDWCGGGFDARKFEVGSVNRKLKRLRVS
mgnify:CR=1 FL=1|nr:plasmid pRiA4b ORF-3 family protein [Pseudomonadales bacterium]